VRKQGHAGARPLHLMEDVHSARLSRVRCLVTGAMRVYGSL
jgi:hypothetical protein